MKFYKRFPGDITIKTGDLNLMEFGAYDRLLDHYYAKEQPIDPARVYSVARAMTAPERQAVDKVLLEFWTLTPEGWVQKRADETIAEALPRIEAARKNGQKGGRPPKPKPTGFSGDNPNATSGLTQSGVLEKGSQSQKPEKKKTPPNPLPGEPWFVRFWDTWPSNTRKAARAQCLAKWKAKDCEAIGEQIVAHVEALKQSEQWQRDGGRYVPAPLVYLNQSRWEAATSDQPWHATRSGVEAKGVELGLGKWDEHAAALGQGEQFAAYEARVRAAAERAALEPA